MINPLFFFQFQFLEHTIIDSHVEYTISILNPENGQTIFLRSRYSLLLSLHLSLKEAYTNKNFPNFPPKKCIGNLNESFIQIRKKLLERYFNELFSDKSFYDDFRVKDFLRRSQRNYELVVFKNKNTSEGTPDNLTNLAHSRSINGLNLSLNRNLSPVAFLRRSSSLKLEDFSKNTPGNQSNNYLKLSSISNLDDFKLVEETFPNDYFEWMNGILELQGFLLENDLILPQKEEKWLNKIRIQGILNEKKEFLILDKEKNIYLKMQVFEFFKEEAIETLKSILYQICLCKYLADYQQITHFQHCFYEERYRKKHDKVSSIFIVFQEIPSRSNIPFTLKYLIDNLKEIPEKMLMKLFDRILKISDHLKKAKIAWNKISINDFFIDLENDQIKLINIENCEYFKNGIPNQIRNLVKENILEIFILLKYGKIIEKENLKNILINNLVNFSEKIIFKMLNEDWEENDIFKEFPQKKNKKELKINMQINQLVLKIDKNEMALGYSYLKNYKKSVRFLKEIEKEMSLREDLSEISSDLIEKQVRLKLSIAQILKKSDANLLFIEEYLIKAMEFYTDFLSSNPDYYNLKLLILKKKAKFYLLIGEYEKPRILLLKEITDVKIPILFQIDFNKYLSICYRETDRNTEAMKYIELSLAILDKKTIKYADFLIEKALIYLSNQEKENLNQGIKLLNYSLSIYKENYENCEIRIGNVKELIGITHMKLNEYTNAVQSLEEAWAIKKSISFTIPQSIENLLIHLSKCHYGLKDLPKAQSFLNMTSTIIKEKNISELDKSPKKTKKTKLIEGELRALKAKIYLESEKWLSAKKNVRKALKIYKKVLGKSSLIIGEMYDIYGKVCLRLNEVDKAKKCFLRGLTMFRLNLGEANEKTIEIAETIAELDLQLGEYEDALLNYQELIDLYKEKLSGQKEKIGDFLLKLGFINYKIENYSDAKESLKEADLIFRDVIREIGKNDDPEIKNKLISKIQRIQKDLLKMQDLY